MWKGINGGGRGGIAQGRGGDLSLRVPTLSGKGLGRMQIEKMTILESGNVDCDVNWYLFR